MYISMDCGSEAIVWRDCITGLMCHRGMQCVVQLINGARDEG